MYFIVEDRAVLRNRERKDVKLPGECGHVYLHRTEEVVWVQAAYLYQVRIGVLLAKGLVRATRTKRVLVGEHEPQALRLLYYCFLLAGHVGSLLRENADA